MNGDELNVPTAAPLGVFRTPNQNPQFEDNEVNYGARGEPVQSDEDVTVGAKGTPIQTGG